MLMIGKDGHAFKALPANRAGVWFLPRVSSQMLQEFGLIGKDFPAIFRRADLLIVDLLVLGQCHLPGKALSAVCTRKLILFIVHCLVPYQMPFAAEALVTVRARIWLLSRVCSLMLLEIRSLIERFLAFGARKEFVD